jgi:hypothetical protein
MTGAYSRCSVAAEAGIPLKLCRVLLQFGHGPQWPAMERPK